MVRSEDFFLLMFDLNNVTDLRFYVFLKQVQRTGMLTESAEKANVKISDVQVLCNTDLVFLLFLRKSVNNWAETTLENALASNKAELERARTILTEKVVSSAYSDVNKKIALNCLNEELDIKVMDLERENARKMRNVRSSNELLMKNFMERQDILSNVVGK